VVEFGGICAVPNTVNTGNGKFAVTAVGGVAMVGETESKYRKLLSAQQKPNNQPYEIGGEKTVFYIYELQSEFLCEKSFGHLGLYLGPTRCHPRASSV
jgi:hypothetical protein